MQFHLNPLGHSNLYARVAVEKWRMAIIIKSAVSDFENVNGTIWILLECHSRQWLRTAQRSHPSLSPQFPLFTFFSKLSDFRIGHLAAYSSSFHLLLSTTPHFPFMFVFFFFFHSSDASASFHLFMKVIILLCYNCSNSISYFSPGTRCTTKGHYFFYLRRVSIV